MTFTQFIAGLWRLWGLIKGGVVGAVALTVVCITLLLVVGAIGEGYPFIGHAIDKHTKRWALDQSYAPLAIVSSIGFILGAIASVRYPQVVQKWFSSALTLGVVMSACFWLLDSVAARLSVPHTIKLADCTNSIVNFQLNAPRGHGYQLELLTPGAQTTTPNGSIISSYKFSGHVRISSGTSLIADLPIACDKTEFIPSAGFILAGVNSRNATVPLGQFLQPQKDYDIKIVFDPAPPPSSSICLYWLQSRMDMEK